MKKLVIAFLLLVFPMMAFAGCGNAEENYWSDTYEKAAALSTVDAVESTEEQNISKVVAKDIAIEIQGNSAFLAACGNDAAYQELALYGLVLKANLLLFNEYLPQIDFTPTLVEENETKEVKKLFSTFNGKIDSFKNEIKEFLAAKAAFEAKSTRTDFVPTATSSIQYLEDFKGAYVQLIANAKEFNNQFENIFVGNYAVEVQTVSTEIPLTGESVRLANLLAKKLVAESIAQVVIETSEGKTINTLLSNASTQFIESLGLPISVTTTTEIAADSDSSAQYQIFMIFYQAVKTEKNSILAMIDTFNLKDALVEFETITDTDETYVPSLTQQKLQKVFDFWHISIEILNDAAFRQSA